MNILMGTLHTALVAWSAIGETPVPFHMFFATTEIGGDIMLCMRQLNLSTRACHRTRSVKLAVALQHTKVADGIKKLVHFA